MTPSIDAAVFDALSASGIPGTRVAWGIDKPQKPRFTYKRMPGGETFADSSNYATLPRYRAKLHIDEFDPDVIDAFTSAVQAIGPYTYGEDYDEDDPNGYVCVYEFTFTR